tara:strand:+ start:10771 stop:11340 length:570 start_codon:yes stop_codon:yes gene_type:complete
MINISRLVDWEFIAELEGGCATIGYVPPPDGGKVESGVTIATGFDLGQRSATDIKALPDYLIVKLTPFLGLTGNKAIYKLKECPLVLTKTEALQIDNLSHREALVNLLKDWAAADTSIDYRYLDKNLRTVIASVAFQYGDLPSRTPKFWSQVTSNQWVDAYYNLLDFKDNFRTRRHKEAAKVRGVIYGD